MLYKDIFTIFNNSHQVSLADLEISEDGEYLLLESNSLNTFLLKEINKPKNASLLLNAIKTKILIDNSSLYMTYETIKMGQVLTKKIDAYLGIVTDTKD